MFWRPKEGDIIGTIIVVVESVAGFPEFRCVLRGDFRSACPCRGATQIKNPLNSNAPASGNAKRHLR